MEYYSADAKSAAIRIANDLNQALQSGSVLWLLSGGSNIALAVEIRKLLEISNQLTVGLVDERYGPVGHRDSNWQQLIDAGFNSKRLTVMPILHGEERSVTAKNYEVLLQNTIPKHETVVGLFGLGTDGHTAGILPASPALKSTSLVCDFDADDYQRITITPSAIRFLNLAYLVTFGSSKKDQLDMFSSSVTINKQPAQTLKQVPKLTIISDQIGDI